MSRIKKMRLNIPITVSIGTLDAFASNEQKLYTIFAID